METDDFRHIAYLYYRPCLISPRPLRPWCHQCERIYGDQITGTSAYGERPELSKCLDGLRDGDTLVIHELDRLGRSMVEMLVQVNGLIERGVAIKTLDGRLDTASMPEELVKLVVGMMGYAAEMELKSIKKRTAEGR